jgi:hypothetical protein
VASPNFNYKPSDYREADEWLADQIKLSKKNGIYTADVSLDPPLAKALLSRNDGNRRISRTLVDTLARDIETNAWRKNGETLIVANDGQLNDGQHRATAVIETGIPIPVIIVFGVDRESRTTVDQGFVRTIANYLDMEGHHNTTTLGSTAKNVWQWKVYGELSDGSAHRPNKSELLKLIAEEPDIEKSVSFARGRSLHLNAVGGVSMVGFVHYAITRETPVADADAFVQLLSDGAGLGRDHPILHLRNRLIVDRTRLRANEKAELLFRGWNAYRRGATTLKSVPLMGGPLPVLEK